MEVSRGVVMKPATSAGSAPVYTVWTVTTAFWVKGYWRTCKSPTERRPRTRISRLTTVARTGRRIKISVKCMCVPFVLLVHRLGGRFIGGLYLVIDDYRDPVLEFNLP